HGWGKGRREGQGRLAGHQGVGGRRAITRAVLEVLTRGANAIPAAGNDECTVVAFAAAGIDLAGRADVVAACRRAVAAVGGGFGGRLAYAVVVAWRRRSACHND